MQTVLTYLTLLLTGMILHAQNTIEVNMTGFDSNDGTVMVGLYNDEGAFLDTPQKSISSKITNQKANVTFTDIPDGIYAISCYHDEDDNGELNMILGFYPKESYGTSNNAPARFGPPKMG
jgi:Uncharacterized protein conserved in bacteria